MNNICDPVETVERPAWMQAEPTQRLMQLLGAGRARFVGGCVRNMLLGEGAGDVDIATQLTPHAVMDILGRAEIKTIPTGIEHGTITAVIDGLSFEITTLRKDVETDGRRAVVAFTEDWVEDAQRRDFTMNTLLADSAGNIYDPTGRGLADLRARRVIFVGEAAQRIAEDYLRILRFFRFHGLYGAGTPDADALKACAAAADKISTLSRERITQELFKMIMMDDPSEILSLMFSCSVLKDLDFDTLNILKRSCAYQNSVGANSIAARLFAVIACAPENLEVLDEYVQLPKAVRKQIEALGKILTRFHLSEERDIKIALYHYDGEIVLQAAILQAALGRIDAQRIAAVKALSENWDIPVFPIKAKDLMAQGFEPGPALGAELKRLEAEWIARGFSRD